MTPVDQICSNDCMRACICSILGRDINSVPNFMERGRHYFNELLDEFLNENGLKLIEFDVSKESDRTNFMNALNDCYIIVVGESPRYNCNHAVIFYNGEMVHDPHPSKEGIKGHPVLIDIIIKKDYDGY